MTPSSAASASRASCAGARILDGVDVEVASGELLAVAGPNGAGKTTLLRLLAGDGGRRGARSSSAGCRSSGSSRTELARRRAVMPQHTAIGFGFTVRQVVEMGCHPLRETYEGLDEVVEESLERAGMALISRSEGFGASPAASRR